jgi:hypothetical protein
LYGHKCPIWKQSSSAESKIEKFGEKEGVNITFAVRTVNTHDQRTGEKTAIIIKRNSDDGQAENATLKTTIIMMKLKSTSTQVLKLKRKITKGFSTPDTSVDDSGSLVIDLVTPDVDDDFQAGDECYGTFGDMQDDDEKDEYYEEFLVADDVDSDIGGSSYYSEHTIDEEEYETYLETLKDHKVEDFNEWRASEHFPQHLFPRDDEFDEFTINSEEFDDCLSHGGTAIDWTGKKLTLKTEKKKKEKKTRKIKIKKKSRKHSSKSKSSSDDGPEKKSRQTGTPSSSSRRKSLISREKSSKKVTTSRKSSIGAEDSQDKSSKKSPVSRRSAIATEDSQGKSSKKSPVSRRSSKELEGFKDKSSKKISASRRSSIATEDSQDKSTKKSPVSRRSSMGTEGASGTRKRPSTRNKKKVRHNSLGALDKEKARQKLKEGESSRILSREEKDGRKSKSKDKSSRSVLGDGTSKPKRSNSLGILDTKQFRRSKDKSINSSKGSKSEELKTSSTSSRKKAQRSSSSKPSRASSMGKLGDARIRVSKIAEAPVSPGALSTELFTKTSPKNRPMSMREISTFEPFGVSNKTNNDFDMFVSDRNLVKPQSTKSFASNVGSMQLQAMLAKPPERKQGKRRASMVIKRDRSTGTLPTVDTAISSGEVCW